MQWKTAGVFNRLTNGRGDVMNGTDALIAREMNRNRDEIARLESKRTKWIAIEKKIKTRDSVYTRLNEQKLDLLTDPHNFTTAELKAIITLKDPQSKVSSTTQKVLYDLWSKRYHSSMPFPAWDKIRWKKENEKRLKRLEVQKIPDLERTSVYQDMMKLRSDLFSRQLATLPDEHLSHVFATVLPRRRRIRLSLLLMLQKPE
jgi:hypothetical protein